ncbi:MAG: hypothetical protein GEV11_15965 [Streptosporangiales bacterium]|nr:hypothetical protein [Streptosporangiales bacterium]
MWNFLRRFGAESDVPADRDVAGSRAFGGVPNAAYPDQQCTTGTTPNGLFVGRVAGEDVGAFEESGAERRAAAVRARARDARARDQASDPA